MRILLAVLAASLAACGVAAADAQSDGPHCRGSAACFYGVVTKVVDGDTIDVNDIRIRLSLVDTPERGEPLYREATAFVSSRCPVGLTVLVDEDDRQTGGSYGRMIGAVWCQGEMINAELAGSRYAEIVTRFCHGSEFGRSEWAVAGGCPGPAEPRMAPPVRDDQKEPAVVPDEPPARDMDGPAGTPEDPIVIVVDRDDIPKPPVYEPEPAAEPAPAAPVEGGGCLVATAAYGSELAPQVQRLRELRDTAVLGTESGRQFMNIFNTVYYAFSPAVSDAQRQHPALNSIVRAAITPMMISLSLLEYADSEAGIIMYGGAIISLNAAIYLGPVVLLGMLAFRARSGPGRRALS